MSAMLSRTLSPLIKFFASNDGPINRPQPAKPPSTSDIHAPNEVSFGVRRVLRNRRSVREIVLRLIRTDFADTPILSIGQSPAHTVWISGDTLFAVNGFRTKAITIKELSVATRFTKARLSGRDGQNVSIEPHGPAWRQFFEQLNVSHPDIKVGHRIWAMTSRSNDNYEYFER